MEIYLHSGPKGLEVLVISLDLELCHRISLIF